MFTLSTSFTKHVDLLIPHHPDDASSVLIMAGDISSSINMIEKTIEHIHDRFLGIVYVAGNHEYYGHVRQDQEYAVKRRLAPFKNVTYVGLDVALIELDNVSLVAGTLWGDGGITVQENLRVQQFLRCFKLIKNTVETDEAPYSTDLPYTVSMMHDDNLDARAGFKNALEYSAADRPDIPVVMVSHYIPFRSICHPRFGGQIDGGFASDCHEVVSNVTPSGWIFGHTHDTYHEVVGGIPMYCNPSGYRHEKLSGKFVDYQIRFIKIANLPKITTNLV